MTKRSGILGVDHIAVFTARIEEAEAAYVDLFQATVLFRGTTHRDTWVAIDATHPWEEIRRRGIRVEATFLRAGGLTIVIADEPQIGRGGPLNHVGIGTSDGEFRRIKERVRELGLRFREDSLESFKFHDAFGVLWEVSRGAEISRPSKRLDLETGRII